MFLYDEKKSPTNMLEDSQWPKKASKKKYNYWQQKVEKFCHHY